MLNQNDDVNDDNNCGDSGGDNESTYSDDERTTHNQK